MKDPVKSDFTVSTTDAEVTVTFRPTNSVYTFPRLADGTLGANFSVRHGGSGDTGEYPSGRVKEIAEDLALTVHTSQ